MPACVCAERCLCLCAWGNMCEFRGNVRDSVLSFHHEGPGFCTWVVRVGSQHFYLLSHFVWLNINIATLHLSTRNMVLTFDLAQLCISHCCVFSIFYGHTFFYLSFHVFAFLCVFEKDFFLHVHARVSGELNVGWGKLHLSAVPVEARGGQKIP